MKKSKDIVVLDHGKLTHAFKIATQLESKRDRRRASLLAAGNMLAYRELPVSFLNVAAQAEQELTTEEQVKQADVLAALSRITNVAPEPQSNHYEERKNEATLL